MRMVMFKALQGLIMIRMDCKIGCRHTYYSLYLKTALIATRSVSDQICTLYIIYVAE